MGFFTSLKMWLIITILVGSLGTVGYYVHRYQTMELEMQVLQGKQEVVANDLTSCLDTSAGQGITLGIQNKRIEDYNSDRLKEVQEAEAWIAILTEVIYVQEENNQKLRKSLENITNETQEVIEDDEEFADWADNDMPDAGWRLLRESTKDRID